MSALRCKQGDLAVVVRATQTPAMLGRLVIVERLLLDGERVSRMPVKTGGLPCWVIRSAVDGDLLPWPSANSNFVHMVPRRAYLDIGLRPIRPNEGEDESFSCSRQRAEEVA